MSQSVIGALRVNLGLDSAQFSRGAKRAQSDMQRLASVMSRLGAVIGGAISVRGIVQMADSWSDMRSRVGAAIGDMDGAGAVMARLSDIADRTYSSLQQTADGFARNANTLRDLGLSLDQALDYTESLNNAMVVSGAKGDQAERVQRALSNAMSTGALRGDNLNTVLEAGGRVAQLLADELGVTTLELRNIAASGKITGGVIQQALIGNLERLREEADAMPATIGDAFLRIGNAATRLVGQFDQFTGASSSVATALVTLAENLQRILAYAGTAAAIVGGRMVAAMVAARIATISLSGALVFLRGALIRTGIGAVIVLAGEMVYQFTRLVSATGGWGQALSLLGEVAAGVWQGIVGSAKAIPAGLDSVWQSVRSGFLLMISDLLDRWSTFLQSLAGSIEGLPGLGGAFDSLQSSITGVIRASGDYAAAAGEASGASEALAASARDMAGEGFARAGDALARLRSVMSGASDEASTASASFGGLDGAFDEIGGGSGGGSAGRAASGIDAVSDAARAAQQQSQQMSGMFSNAFASVISGAQSAKDALAGLLQQLSSMLANQAFTMLFQGLFGAPKLATGSQLLGGLLGSFGGFRADGGPVSAGRAYVVGERGPEMFVPRVGGQIVPNGAMGGGRAVLQLVAPPGFSVEQRGEIEGIAIEVTTSGLQQYDRTALPASVRRINGDPRRRG